MHEETSGRTSPLGIPQRASEKFDALTIRLRDDPLCRDAAISICRPAMARSARPPGFHSRLRAATIAAATIVEPQTSGPVPANV
jgi:hypothetical protein